jgi:plastocyanin
MPKRPLLVPASLFLALIAAIFIGACSSGGSSSPTYPAPGGGGGGGTTFSLSFPATGSSQQFTFPTAGTFAYHCIPHGGSGMTGTVTVSASASADSDTVAVGRDASYNQALSFKPNTTTIKPGGHVRWINRSSMVNHTVTSP